MRNLFLSLASLLTLLALAGPAYAANYEVGAGKTYANLEALRAASITWADGDSITVFNDDASLTAPFNFSDKAVSIQGQGLAIIPADPLNPGRFASGAGALSFTGTTLSSFTAASGPGGGHGGAIYAGGAFSGTITGSTFSANQASGGADASSGHGGAIYANGDFSGAITGSTFRANQAIGGTGASSGYGGAIYAGGSFTSDISNSRFINNLASGTGASSGRGGAMYVGGDLSLTALDGSAWFRGNKAGPSGAEAPNALYLANELNNKTLSLAAGAGHTLYFYDPIESNAANPNLTISINPDAGHSGTVLFDGSDYSNAADKTSKVYGHTTVQNGVFALKGANYNADAGDFTVASGATLLGSMAGGVSANNINLKLGSILAFDLTGVATVSTPVLGFTSNTKFTDDNRAVDIRAFNGSGTFNLAQTLDSFDSEDKTLTVRGTPIADTRANGTKLELDVSSTLLVLKATVNNGPVIWTGGAGDNIWNATSTNWKTADTAITGSVGDAVKFLHGDAAYFAASDGVTRTIAVQAQGVQVADRGTGYPGLTFGGGSWQFRGGEIEGGAMLVNAGNNTLAFSGRAMRQRLTVSDAGVIASLRALAATDTLSWQGFIAPGLGGLGGAVYVGNGATLNLGASPGGQVLFNANQASGGAGISSGHGGAIYADGAFSGTITGSTFSANQASGGTGASSGHGGAIYANGDFSGAITGSTFSANQASGGAGTSSGHGGAMYVGGSFTSDISNSRFINNLASGTDSSSGRGGAMYVGGDLRLTALAGSAWFRGNKAGAGGAEAPNALYMANELNNKTLSLAAGAGHTLYFYDPIESNAANNNLTININPNAGHIGKVLFDAYQSKIYGATTLHNGVLHLTNGAQYGAANSVGSFTLNSGADILVDAKANRISANNITLAGGGKVSALLSDAAPGDTNLILDSDPVNPIVAGEKITVDALNTGALNGTYHIVRATNDFVFSTGNVNGLFDGRIFFNAPNPRYGKAVYDFSNVGFVNINVSGADSARQATWTGAAGDGEWNLASKNWSLSGNPGALNGWFKAGDSVLFTGAGQGAVNVDAAGMTVDQMTVTNGAYTFAGGKVNGNTLTFSGGAATVANHLDFSGATLVGRGATLNLTARGDISPSHIASGVASFTLAGGARLNVEPRERAYVLRSGVINLQSGSTVGLAGFNYGPMLSKGNHTVLTLDASSVTNKSSLAATSGTITVGPDNYRYSNLAWDGNNLTMTVSGGGRDPSLAGVSAMTGPTAIAFYNPALNAFGQHARGLFNKLSLNPSDMSGGQSLYATASEDGGMIDATRGTPEYLNNLWVTPYYSDTSQSARGGNVGYDLQTPGFAFGYDRQITEQAFVGLGVSVSWPDYSGGDTDIDANDVTFALYGGARLPYAVELDAHIGYGWTRYDQDRSVRGERYSDKYDGNTFFVGLGLGRSFAIGENSGFSLRPGAAYDYIRVDTDGFDEGSGAYALKSDSYTQNLHRVNAGLEVNWTGRDSGVSVSGEVYYLGLYGDRKAETSGRFINDPANGFAMIGNGLDQDNLGLGLNVCVPVSERWELGAGYNALLGSDTVSQQGMVSVKFKF